MKLEKCPRCERSKIFVKALCESLYYGEIYELNNKARRLAIAVTNGKVLKRYEATCNNGTCPMIFHYDPRTGEVTRRSK